MNEKKPIGIILLILFLLLLAFFQAFLEYKREQRVARGEAPPFKRAAEMINE